MKARDLVGKVITRVSLRARKATGIEVKVTGRWVIEDCTSAGGLILGPSLVPELIPGYGREKATEYLHASSVLDRATYFNSSKKLMTCDGIALLVDADENRERSVMEEMVNKGREYL